MAVKLVDRVRALSTSTGTGAISLGVTPTGFQSFGDALSDGDETYYVITHISDGSWEVGLGTYNSGSLSRDEVLDSSTGSKVSFASGDKDVFATAPAKFLDRISTSYQDSDFTALAGYKYWVNGDLTVTLPPASEGGQIIFTKAIGSTPLIKASGSDDIVTTEGTDIEIIFDVDALIVLTSNGTDWEL